MSKVLPRILYIADVPVDLTSAGSTLLYRMLQYYPADKLCIVQSRRGNEERRLPGVEYHYVPQPVFDRIKITRFRKMGAVAEVLTAPFAGRELKSVFAGFKPDCILTVTSRFYWIKAAKLARKFDVPLHLILHDDIVTGENYGPFANSKIEHHFSKVYRKAASRMCISENMERYYKERYGVGGSVLLPMRGRDDVMSPIPQQCYANKQALHFCYAGSVYTSDFVVMLAKLAKVLAERGHKLFLFTEAGEGIKHLKDFKGEHVVAKGFLHPDELKNFMKENIDVNLLLNSFENEVAFRYNFSSKLVDYSTTGLPVLAWGAPSSGAISWMLEKGYSSVVETDSVESLLREVIAMEKEKYRGCVAEKLREICKESMSYETNHMIFKEMVTLKPEV